MFEILPSQKKRPIMSDHERSVILKLETTFPALDFDYSGSRVITDPPPMDTDVDVVVGHTPGMEELLLELGFEFEGSNEYETDKFNSFRFGTINLIVCHDSQFKDEFLKITRLAKKLNLKNKVDRISLFKAFLYGEF